MRKRRAIIYDDEPIILNVLRMFFELRDYDVITCQEPVRCPVYDDLTKCRLLHPCADVMLTDHRMPRMTGLELLRLQKEQGCRLSIRNKAVISGYMDDDALREVGRLGCASFQKPVEFEELEAWLRACEDRMDLSVRLAFKRKEPRKGCCSETVYWDEQRALMQTGEVLNQSDSGLCLRVQQPPDRGQTVRLMTSMQLSSNRLIVRWMEQEADGRYLIGMSCY
jgi:CheY-like chemotaxis protein